MRTETPQSIYLQDYTPPAYLVDRIDLRFDIRDEYTRVTAELACRRNPAGTGGDFVLQGEELVLEAVGLDGMVAAPSRYEVGSDTLTLRDNPACPLGDAFTLTTVVRIEPDKNTELSGLYRSKDGYFTQCEAEGFRRITFFPDRPDIMARYTVTIEAERERFPHLLSNGNRIDGGLCDDDKARHWARWEDPYAKPSYLFALVAAHLDVLEDEFVTASGRKVALSVFVEPGKREEARHTMAALKLSMTWDEQRYGLEMDLDVFMIVAVGDFNMGAMENKGLNIFNAKYVLASPATATDTDYQAIDRIVAHEYFHNWTGNRVTCRDWFQLSLKEGLTVFRDQEFGADVHSHAVTRIQEVRQLRISQFPEDAGPMAHPVRPASYVEINNFYTATVYQKGAEVVRMIQTLIGREGFRKGMDLYFQRHDGQAVTCDDFVSAMQDASGVDLSQFRRWYTRAGTPRLSARGNYDAATRRYTLHVTQTLAKTPYEQRLASEGFAIDEGPLLIPLALGLVLPDGSDAPLRLADEKVGPGGTAPTTRVLPLTEAEHEYVFENIDAAPIASLLRDFSAPVHLEFDQSDAELAHLMAHDSDLFNRWEAGQRLATRVLLAGTAAQGAGDAWIPAGFAPAMARVLAAGLAGDAAFAAEALMLPAEAVLAEEVVGQGQTIDPEAIFRARLTLRQHLARELATEFEAAWQTLAPSEAYAPSGAQVGRRALRNQCLGYLAEGAPEAVATVIVPRLMAQFEHADNMTDVIAALSILCQLDVPQRTQALAAFHAQWQHEANVIDKWLQVQATSRLSGTVDTVRTLLAHPSFDLKVPNKVFALVRSFCGANPRHFHAADGSGYRLAADVIAELDSINGQIAARIARSFDRWRQFDAGRQAQARAALERLQGIGGLSKNVAEVVGKALAG